LASRYALTLPLAPALAAALFLSGCGRPAGVIFDPANTATVWPPAPDVPRIRYLGALSSSADLKPARGAFQGVGEFLFGAEDPQTMLSPLGVCTDGHERVFVADSNAQLVHVLDMSTRQYQQWRPDTGKPPVSLFVQPVALAFDPGGRLLVADSAAAEIFVFDTAGTPAGTIGKGRLKRPCGVAVEPASRRIFVADAESHQIVVFSSDGQEAGRIGTRGSDLGQFNFPTNVAFDREGRLYVSDSLNFRIQVFSTALAPIRQIGKKGDLPGYFAQPKGIAVDANGHILVVDANFEAIQVFTGEGELLMSFGREGQGAGEFWLPSGICADPQGRLFVADSYNQRIQVFESVPEGAPR
jgi:DNA-binding beta-propeller fold protein YncE